MMIIEDKGSKSQLTRMGRSGKVKEKFAKSGDVEHKDTVVVRK